MANGGNQVVHFCIKFYGIRILPLRSHLQPSVAPTPLLTYFTMAHKSSASSLAMVPPAASGLSLVDSGLSLADSVAPEPADSSAVHSSGGGLRKKPAAAGLRNKPAAAGLAKKAKAAKQPKPRAKAAKALQAATRGDQPCDLDPEESLTEVSEDVPTSQEWAIVSSRLHSVPAGRPISGESASGGAAATLPSTGGAHPRQLATGGVPTHGAALLAPDGAVLLAPGGEGVAASVAARAAAASAALAGLDDAQGGEVLANGGEVLANGGDGVASSTADATAGHAAGVPTKKRRTSVGQDAAAATAAIGDGELAYGTAAWLAALTAHALKMSGSAPAELTVPTPAAAEEDISDAETLVLPGGAGNIGGGPPNASGDAAANTGGGEAMLATGGAKLASGDVGVLADDGGDALS